MALTDIYRVVHPTATEHTFFSAAMELSPKLDAFGTTKKGLTNTKKGKFLVLPDHDGI
jgi:hypothetical protein